MSGPLRALKLVYKSSRILFQLFWLSSILTLSWSWVALNAATRSLVHRVKYGVPPKAQNRIVVIPLSLLHPVKIKTVHSIGARISGIDIRDCRYPLKPTLAGLISPFHILISIPTKLTPRWLLTRLLRWYEQLLVDANKMSGHGGHYMLYMANGLFVVFLDADWYRYLWIFKWFRGAYFMRFWQDDQGLILI